MNDKRLKILSIISMCLLVVMLGIVIATWISINIDVKRLENRITELEERQKYTEYRLMETERPSCVK